MKSDAIFSYQRYNDHSDFKNTEGFYGTGHSKST